MQNNGPLFVGSNATMYMKSGNFTYGTSAATSTLKTRTVGKIAIGSGATSSAGSATQFLDGWVSTLGTADFLFPIGQKGLTENFYAPVKVIPAFGTTVVSTAYFRANPNSAYQTTTLDSSLAKITVEEYWKVSGSAAKLTLTWNLASSIITMTTFQLADVTIAGHNTTTSKWEMVSSSVDVTSILGGLSSIATGSVTSTEDVVLTNYSAFSIGLKGIVCTDLVYTNGSLITWDGTNFSATPTYSDAVTINSAVSPGSFVCNSLLLNYNITLTSTQSIEVINGITGSGKIIMSSQSSLVQRATGVSKPTIELTKATRTLKQFDYTYFGSPIVGDAFDNLTAAKASTFGSATDAFEMKYKYVSGSGGGWLPLTATEIGKVFIARMKA